MFSLNTEAKSLLIVAGVAAGIGLTACRDVQKASPPRIPDAPTHAFGSPFTPTGLERNPLTGEPCLAGRINTGRLCLTQKDGTFLLPLGGERVMGWDPVNQIWVLIH